MHFDNFFKLPDSKNGVNAADGTVRIEIAVIGKIEYSLISTEVYGVICIEVRIDIVEFRFSPDVYGCQCGIAPSMRNDVAG